MQPLHLDVGVSGVAGEICQPGSSRTQRPRIDHVRRLHPGAQSGDLDRQPLEVGDRPGDGCDPVVEVAQDQPRVVDLGQVQVDRGEFEQQSTAPGIGEGR